MASASLSGALGKSCLGYPGLLLLPSGCCGEQAVGRNRIVANGGLMDICCFPYWREVVKPCQPRPPLCFFPTRTEENRVRVCVCETDLHCLSLSEEDGRSLSTHPPLQSSGQWRKVFLAQQLPPATHHPTLSA